MCLNTLLLLMFFSAFVVMFVKDMNSSERMWISDSVQDSFVSLDLPATHWPHKHSRVTSGPLNICKHLIIHLPASCCASLRVFVFTDSGSSDSFLPNASKLRVQGVTEHNCIVSYDGLHRMSYMLISSLEDAVRIMFIILNMRRMLGNIINVLRLLFAHPLIKMFIH